MSKMTMSCALVSSANFATLWAKALDFKTFLLINFFLDNNKLDSREVPLP